MKKFNLKKLSKKQMTVLITSLCVMLLSLGVVAYGMTENKDKVIDKKSTSITSKKDNIEDTKDTKEKDKKDPKKDDVKKEVAPVAKSDSESVDGNTSANAVAPVQGNTNGGATQQPTPTPPPVAVPKVCGAPGVLFDNLPCDMILTQYNLNNWGMGNSGMTFNSSREAWDWGNAQIDTWYADLTKEPPYNGFDGYSIQYNDGSQKWTVMFK